MGRKQNAGELGTVTAVALGMLVLGFLLPTLFFGGEGGRVERIGDDGEEETAQVLLPRPSAGVGEQTGPVEIPPSEVDGARTIRVLGADGAVTEPDLAAYLWGVVAAEMPASFELEALKAQAVAARTYTLWKTLHNGSHPEADVCTDYTCCQAWISREDAAANWGESAEENANKISLAVAATDGMALLWEGGPIQAVYHSSSDGRTEDAVAVWGSTVPYLLGVDTPEGDEVPNYRSAVTLTAEAVAAILAPHGCDLSGDPAAWFQSIARTENGMVSSAAVGGATLSGGTLRELLGLRSASFEVAYADGSFTFTATGYGHGVGMSQYGANALAREGKGWEEIVTWYYTGVTVERYGT